MGGKYPSILDYFYRIWQFDGYISENTGIPLPQPVDLVVFTQPGWQAQGLPVEQGAVARAERN